MFRDEWSAETAPPASGVLVAVILEDVIAEGERLVRAAREAGVDVALLGGVAIRLACNSCALRTELRRSYQDIDIAIRPRATDDVIRFLVAQGYEPNRRFNAINGESRLMFNDQENDRHIDVFVGIFKMCHKLALEPRLALATVTLPASDLLLLKLQIVQLNHKDVLDALTLVLRFEPIEEGSPASLDLKYIAGICASDWGWYRTLSDNLVRVRDLAPQILRDGNDVARVRERITVLLAAVEDAPKPLAWRLRNRIGRRVPWYDLPEEVTAQSG